MEHSRGGTGSAESGGPAAAGVGAVRPHDIGSLMDGKGLACDQRAAGGVSVPVPTQRWADTPSRGWLRGGQHRRGGGLMTAVWGHVAMEGRPDIMPEQEARQQVSGVPQQPPLIPCTTDCANMVHCVDGVGPEAVREHRRHDSIGGQPRVPETTKKRGLSVGFSPAAGGDRTWRPRASWRVRPIPGEASSAPRSPLQLSGRSTVPDREAPNSSPQRGISSTARPSWSSGLTPAVN